MTEPADIAAYRKLKLDEQARHDLTVGGMPTPLFDAFVLMGERNNTMLGATDEPALASMDIYASDVPGQYHWLVSVVGQRVFSIALSLSGQFLPDGAALVAENPADALPDPEAARPFSDRFIDWCKAASNEEHPVLVQLVNTMGLFVDLFFHATQVFQRDFPEGDTQFIYRLKESYLNSPGWSACLTLYADSFRTIGPDPIIISETP